MRARSWPTPVTMMRPWSGSCRRWLDPNNPSVHAHLGYLYELEGDTWRRWVATGDCSSCAPMMIGRARIVHLSSGQFPRRLKLSLLQFSPVSLVTDECRVRLAEAWIRLPCASPIRGVLYPEEMGDQGAAPRRRSRPLAGRG